MRLFYVFFLFSFVFPLLPLEVEASSRITRNQCALWGGRVSRGPEGCVGYTRPSEETQQETSGTNTDPGQTSEEIQPQVTPEVSTTTIERENDNGSTSVHQCVPDPNFPGELKCREYERVPNPNADEGTSYIDHQKNANSRTPPPAAEETQTAPEDPDFGGDPCIQYPDGPSCTGNLSQPEGEPATTAKAPKVNYNKNACNEVATQGKQAFAGMKIADCAKKACTDANGKVDEACHMEITETAVAHQGKKVAGIADQLALCEKERTSAGNCCSNLSSGQCEVAGIGEYVSLFQKTMTTMQQAAAFTNTQAMCQANKQMLNAQSALSALAIGICTKQIYSCTSACQTQYDCDSIADSTTKLKCEELRKMSRACKFLGGNVALESGLQGYVAKATADAQKCANQTIDDGQSQALNCEDPQTAATTPGCLEFICNQPGEMENNPLCREQNNANSGDKPTDGIEEIASNGTDTSALDNPPENPFAEELDQSFQGVDPSLFGGGAGGDGGGPPGGGSAVPSGSGGRGGGGGSGGGGQAGLPRTGKDGKIIRGSGGGKGYISRFSGGGGGGAYAGRGSGAEGKGRSLASTSKFDLKKFLPKGKTIKKGALKGFTRFPSGQLMVPQNTDIFKVHHQSYVNACNRNQAVKGCEFNNRKKLGLSRSARQLNSQYRAQLALQKENKLQMLSRSGVRVKTLKNRLNSESRKTYFMLKYMKKNRLQRVPAKDPYSSLSGKSKNLIKYNKGKYASWHKMQAWINQQNRPRRATTRPGATTPKRLPASRKK